MDLIPNMTYPVKPLAGGAPYHSKDVIVFLQKELSQIGSILTCNSRDYCFHVPLFPFVYLVSLEYNTSVQKVNEIFLDKLERGGYK